MAKRKPGLQKELSNIFDGVPIPTDENQSQAESKNLSEKDTSTPTTPKVQLKHEQNESDSRTAVLEESSESQQPELEAPDSQQQAVVETPHVPQKSRVAVSTGIWDKIRSRIISSDSGASPARQMATIVIVPVLLVVVFFLFSKNFKKPRRPDPAGQAGPITAAHADALDWPIPVVYPETLRDPMKINTVSLSQLPGGTGGVFAVKGIVFSEDDPAVVIGEQILHQGDSIYGAKIVRITRDSVRFEKNGKQWTQKVQ